MPGNAGATMLPPQSVPSNFTKLDILSVLFESLQFTANLCTFKAQCQCKSTEIVEIKTSLQNKRLAFPASEGIQHVALSPFEISILYSFNALPSTDIHAEYPFRSIRQQSRML